MQYQYNGLTPLEIADQFIDSYFERLQMEKFVPYGTCNYPQGLFLSGVEKIYLQNRKTEYSKFIDEFLTIVLDENKRLKRVEGSSWTSLDSLDFRQSGNLLIRKYTETGDKAYLESVGELVESLKTDFPKNAHGGFWHMKSQPNQMWLDGLYMAGPLCAKYAALSGKKEFGEIAINQAILMYENMRDPKNNLLYHGWDDTFSVAWADKETGLSAEKWGRAMGWFCVASVEILEELDSSYKGYKALCGYIRDIFAALAEVQKDNGFWCQVIDKPYEEGNWEESSGTCLITYAMAKAIRLGFIDAFYLKNAKKAYEAVVDSLRTGENGEIILDKICIGTCIDDGDYAHYINRKTVENDLHGGGAFLLMCGEMNMC